MRHRKKTKVLITILGVSWLSYLTLGATDTTHLLTNFLDSIQQPQGQFMQTNSLYERKEIELTENNISLNEEDQKRLEKLKSSWSTSESIAKNTIEAAGQAFTSGNYEEAIDLYKDGLEKGRFSNENLLTILSNLALAYEAYGDSPSATEVYMRIQESVGSGSALYHVAAGRIHLLSEYMEVEEAIADFEYALSIEPNNFDANNVLGLIYLGEYGSEYTNYSSALPHNERVAELQPSNMNAQVNLAITYLELKKAGAAQQVLLDALSRDEYSLPVRYLLMRLYHEEGYAETAKQQAEILVSLFEGFNDDSLVAEIMKSY